MNTWAAAELVPQQDGTSFWVRAQAEDDRVRLVRLIWLYFALLVFEGALRKWIVPQYSDYFLIVRDPVAAVAILFAVRDGYVQPSRLLRGLNILFVGFVLLSAFQLLFGGMSLPVLVFGLRTYFLHVLLVFIMAQVLDERDLRQLMLVTIVLSVPIAVLMAWQFRSSPRDWINLGAGGGTQLYVITQNKIRPAGPFSFITGPVLFFSLTTACLVGAHIGRQRTIALPILCAGWVALLVGAAVSGSRSLIVGLVPVLVAVGIALARQPMLVGPATRMVVTLAAVAGMAWTTSIVQEGVDVLLMRWDRTGTSELSERATSTYLTARMAWTDSPLAGLGIGLGTNAGAYLLGTSSFRLGENEWTRITFEAGPVLGLAYIAWRMWFAAELIRSSLRAVVSSGAVLPAALAGACALSIIFGQWGQPTTQGFSVWVAGLCLAACRLAEVDADADADP